MLRRQRTGSVVCASCGVLVGVNDETCYGCGRRNPGLWGYGPAIRALGRDMGFVPFVMGTCVFLYALTLIATIKLGGDISGGNPLNFMSPIDRVLYVFGASGGTPVFQGHQWWSVLSAGWLHGGLLHIVFNMFALRQIAPGTAELYGPGRMVIIYTAGSIAGFILSSVAAVYFPYIPLLGGGSLAAGAPYHITVGASASLAGLIGALLHYGRRGGSGMARAYASQYIFYMAIYGALLRAIDNYAHIGGFLGGYLAARVLDPLKPERIDHLVIALVCLALSILAVVVSFVAGMPLLRQGG